MARTEGEGTGKLARLPLKRGHGDPLFWARITSLWHRERMREVYVAAGEPECEARARANKEALEIAHRHGWTGDMTRLAAELADLVVRGIPLRGESDLNGNARYWEDGVQADLLALLKIDPETLRFEVEAYLRSQAQLYGRFTGRDGFYRLAHIVAFVPPMEQMEARNAFFEALHEFGHDPECCELGVYRVVLRMMRSYTRRPLGARLRGSAEPRSTRKPRPRP